MSGNSAFAAREAIEAGEWDAYLGQLAEAVRKRTILLMPSVNPRTRYPLPKGQVWAWMNPHDDRPGQWEVRGTGVVLPEDTEPRGRGEVAIERYVIDSRKICWPNPDATCLHGGCGYCEYGQWKTMDQLERYARAAGTLPHRGQGEEDALHALAYGLSNDFFNKPVRTSRARLEKWAERLGALALNAMAKGMPQLRESKRGEVLDWLLRHRRDVLEDSYRIEAHAMRVVR